MGDNRLARSCVDRIRYGSRNGHGDQAIKRDLKAMEARRQRGMRMLKRGVAQVDIARELEVSRQTVSTWVRRLADDPQA